MDFDGFRIERLPTANAFIKLVCKDVLVEPKSGCTRVMYYNKKILE